MKEEINILHWDFFKNDKQGDKVFVYEEREGDTIGELTDGLSLDELKEKLSNITEQEVFDYIDSHINYF